MPGIAYCFIALDRTIRSLKTGNAQAQAIAALLLDPDNSAFAKLGALGPILRDHTPLIPQEFEIWQETAEVAATLQTDGLAAFDTESSEDQDAFRRIVRLQRRITMVGFTSLFGMVRTTWPLLDRGFALMDDLDRIVKDKDLGALRDKQGEIEAFRVLVDGNDGGDDTGNAFDFEDQFALLNELNIRARPPIMSEQSGNASLTDTFGLTTPGFWRESDLMRWRASGTFVQALLANATTDRQRAYAYGYMIHIAACVTGQPFLNAIAGGPARSHWWRHRLISHHVDTWAHGYYAANAQMQGDTPSPPYAQWPDLCAARLHDQIDLGFALNGLDLLDVVLGSSQDGTPVPLPDNAALTELAEFLSQTATQVYVDGGAYQGLADVIGFDTAHDFGVDAFRRAYFGLSAVLWLQTSGEGPTCPRPFTATPPDDCFDTPPSWVETNAQPPDPQGNKGATAAAIILAILAFLLALAGGLGAGLAALAGAIGATVVATDDFWDSVRCMLYWQRYSLAQIENRVSAFLVLGTLVPPAASKLAGIHPENGMDGPVLDQSGRPLTRTTVPDPDYPRQMDRGGAAEEAATYAPDLGYMSYPAAAGAEEPLQIIWPSIGANRYANFAMDGDGMWPLLSGGILSPVSFPANVGAEGQPLWLGNTVENAVQIVQAEAAGLANYNLDADRGYGWVEWAIPLLSLASDPPINASNPS